jgi:hypothetical protein
MTVYMGQYECVVQLQAQSRGAGGTSEMKFAVRSYDTGGAFFVQLRSTDSVHMNRLATFSCGRFVDLWSAKRMRSNFVFYEILINVFSSQRIRKTSSPFRVFYKCPLLETKQFRGMIQFENRKY